MYNPEMGMGIPQELKERHLEDNLERNENQEITEALMKEFQEEEKEKLFSKESKEKTPKSRIKKALCAITAGLILFGSAEAGFAGLGGISGEGKVNYNQENSIDLIKNQIIEKEASVTDRVEITPEFQRNMEKVLLSIPSQGFSQEEVRKIYHDLLVKMPNYSTIQALVGKDQEEKFKKIIDDIQEQEKCDLYQRMQIISTNNPDELEMWAQDFGEMAKINGIDTFIISAGRGEDFFYKDQVDRDKRRQTMVRTWLQKQGLEIKQADFFLQGGNISFDKTEKGLRVFVGYSDIFYSQHLGKKGDQKPTPQTIAKKISQCFGGAEVVVMGDKELIGTCFHIDQAFVILDNKQAVINQCSSPCFDGDVDVSQQLRYYKMQLEGLGYKIIEIENTPQQLKDSHSSTNVIPFVDKNTGQKKVILPIFPGEIREDAIDNQEINPSSLQGKGLAAYHAYLKAGYEPILVRDYTAAKRGNIHCISNVLAKHLEKYDELKKA
ncbi:MAG: agmatine deiminase family protein [bacterium]